ncbi:MAG: hypothetical protein V4632_15810 [Pseudomonadota bacterium]
MDKFQVLSLMMRKDNQIIDADLYSISALMADALADVSGKLNQQEIYRLIDIGAAIYRHGLQEFGAGVPMDDLFPACENWTSFQSYR